MHRRPTKDARPGQSRAGHPGRHRTANKANKKVFCTHCDTYVTLDILKKHRDGLATPQVSLPSIPPKVRIPTIDDELGGPMDVDVETTGLGEGFIDDGFHEDSDIDIDDSSNGPVAAASHPPLSDDGGILELESLIPDPDTVCSPSPPTLIEETARAPLPQTTSQRVTVEDVPDEDDINIGPSAPDDDDDWEGEMDESIRDQVNGLSLEDLIAQNLEQELAEFATELTDEELVLLRRFAHKLEHHLTDDAFDEQAWAFANPDLETWKVAKSRVEFLAKFLPVPYDCCVNSCCAFAGPHADETNCPYCKEPRYKSDGKRPRKQFNYIPLIPRLVGYFRSQSMIDKMAYRGLFKNNADGVEDVFDGKLYNLLQETYVKLNGVDLPYKHFESLRDVALGLSTDGFAPWRRRKKTCWPLLVYNYNLPPEVRFHFEHILCVGVIPGPKKPKDFDSFAWPLVTELMQLSKGVRAFDVSKNETFHLRAYLMLIFGDIPAVSLVSHMVGHNGVRPCRTCNIRGVKEPGGRTNYVPLDRSCHPDVSSDPTATQSYDPLHLPLRTHDELRRQADEVQFAPNVTRSKELATEYGVKGHSIFFNLSSIVFPLSFPYDFMHLVYENVLKNLVALWTGAFKDMDEGTGAYQFEAGIWEKIGEATAASGAHIPSAFGASPPNVADDKQATTADSWSFWLLYIAPALLQHRFPRPIYYDHFMELVQLVHLCLQFHTSRQDIQRIRMGFSRWVQTYERLYYQYNPSRMRACPLTIHALLHLADHIETCGPVWAYWAFPTERFCGRLQPAIKSRRYPFASIDNYVTQAAQLSQIKVTYNLEDALTRPRLRAAHKTRTDTFSLPTYESCILLPPHNLVIPPEVHKKVQICLATRYGVNVHQVRKHYCSEKVSQWACIRRLDGGDDMKALSLATTLAEDRRDATFVRYDLLVDTNANYRGRQSHFVTKQFFGQLQNILVVPVPATMDFQLEEEETLILANIQTCKTKMRKLSGTTEVPFYSDIGRHEVVDVSTVQCLVGKIPTPSDVRPMGWTFIDRSGTLERSFYIAGE